MKVEFKCSKCGKAQEPDEIAGDWEVFDPKEVCSCGEKFVLHLDDKEVSGYGSR